MTLDQLRIFVAVAERQHVTKAAQALNLAQSAASHAIAALEARHDTRLFNRIGRHIELTEAGAAFLLEARAVLARVERAELTLAEYGTLLRGTLAVQASQTIASYWLPRHLVAFRLAYPGIDIHLAVGNTTQVAAAVDSGAAEIGFVEAAVPSERFTLVPVARDQLIVLVPPGHPWEGRGDVTIAEMMAAEWVLREPGSGTRSVFEEAMRPHLRSGSGLRVVLELPSNEAVRAAVEAGMGATALSASVAAPSLEAGLLRQVPFPLPEREFYLLLNRERAPSRAAEALVNIVTDAYPELLAQGA
ncbi:LysR substrate-binding domain-containing protein [Ancylobacter sp. MQZ15Z-1]|uniref:LysR substrate-binding domain-containing protein n=1 Tax=Ancylobacter mangrovi TaxID=2972472 RepID=A0A9X2PN87_9HYPH|nr:LysR substrate-binding domain-containing protein [Ancylobacter mangrovi]MCS0496903.1 LysR substrate-binding domain-containing protein [Ancylobacter mangrovi]